MKQPQRQKRVGINERIKQEIRTPYVTFQPRSARGLQQGIDMLVAAIKPTLGPVPRLVAVERIGMRDREPELLDSGALIARRVLQVADRDADVGAMFLRHVLWRQRERTGDGTATTAVLFQAVYNQAQTYLAADGNAPALRRGLMDGLEAILDELRRAARPVAGPERIREVAYSICHDEELAALLGEMFDTVSEHGAFELRNGRRPESTREYVLGTYYKGKVLSEWMWTDHLRRRAEVHDPAVLVTDFEITQPADLRPVFDVVAREGIRSLLVLARELSEPVIAAMLQARTAPVPCQIIAVKAPDAITGQAAMLDDIAALTGARRFIAVAGDSLRTLKADQLGRARRAWGDHEYFGIVGGKGDPRALRQHVAALRRAADAAEEPEERHKLRERVGKLLGGTAVLWVGGIAEPDIEARKEEAETTVEAVRAAISAGTLPGGGVALLACRARLREMLEASDHVDHRAAYRVLIRALEEPIRTIIANAGYDAAPLIAQIERAGAGYGIDARSGTLAQMEEAGIVDSAGVLLSAVHEAIASAALALTVDVVVHTKRPKFSFEP
jgi:chaperonin GroEL